MKRECRIDIHHLTRVEGHANIHISVRDGQLVEANWAVVETPRFFEVMLKGMSAEMAPFLTSRICGICSISHALASIRAVERAMEIHPPVAATGPALSRPKAASSQERASRSAVGE